MKKIICAFLMLFLLCSCSSHRDVRVVNKGISFKAHIFYSSEEYICSVGINEKGESTFKVAEGSLSGFTALCSGEKMTLSYEGKEIEQNYSLFADSPFVIIAGMFSYFDSNSYSIEENDNSYFVKGESSAGKVTLFVSPAGLPISAQLDSGEFSVNFYDVTVENES